MFGAFTSFGKLGSLARAIAAAWTPAALWPTGTEAGMWIDPSNLASQWQDSTGTTPVATPGTVADSSNPVGLALDLRLGATALTDPGNHLLQATSTARPLVSARVNLLTYSEDFSNAVWNTNENASKGAAVTDPLGGNKAITVTATSANGDIYQLCSNAIGPSFTNSIYIRRRTGSGAIQLGTPANAMTTVAVTGEWQRFYAAGSSTASGTSNSYLVVRIVTAGDAVDIAFGQINLGSTALPYQRVGAASDYTATGITPFQLYDGVDDGMATASFAAGTLINGMDCMIAVRRDSAASALLGPYNGSPNWFGLAFIASPDPCFANVGTPTVWVDGTQLSGGTAVSRNTLHTAVTAGSWHIMEFRGLDLSAWTGIAHGGYGSSVNFLGARGDIMLYPSTASTTDKDAARQYLADKYGVTLP